MEFFREFLWTFAWEMSSGIFKEILEKISGGFLWGISGKNLWRKSPKKFLNELLEESLEKSLMKFLKKCEKNHWGILGRTPHKILGDFSRNFCNSCPDSRKKCVELFMQESMKFIKSPPEHFLEEPSEIFLVGISK